MILRRAAVRLAHLLDPVEVQDMHIVLGREAGHAAARVHNRVVVLHAVLVHLQVPARLDQDVKLVVGEDE